MKKSVAIFGLGRFGEALVKEFNKMKVDVIAVDKDEEKINEYMNIADYAVCANAADKNFLQQLGVKNVDRAFVSFGSDLQSSILTCLLLKELGVTEVWAKAKDDNHSKILEKIGVDRIIHPEREAARRIAKHSLSSKMIEFLELSDDYSVVEIRATQKINGVTLGNLNIRQKYGCTVAGIHRDDQFIISPATHETIYANDILIVIGHNKEIMRLEKEVV